MMSKESIKIMLKEAPELAQAAVVADNQQDYAQAVDLYDNTILTFEEGRSLLLPVPLPTSMAITPEGVQAAVARTNKRQSLVAFHETDAEIMRKARADFEPPPKSLVALPYWQLRVLGRTIERGGLVTPTLHVPRDVWQQHGLKFSALQVKTMAFQDIVSTVNTTIAPLAMPSLGDHQGMWVFVKVLAAAHRDMIALQNQLSRSFPFVAEVSARAAPDSPDAPAAAAAAATVAAASASEKADSSNLGGMGRLQGLTSLGLSMVSSMGKSMRKTLEIGVSRFNALPASVTEPEFAAYTELVRALCGKAQLLDEWYRQLDLTREQLVQGGGSGGSSSSSGGDGSGGSEADVSRRVADIESALTSLCHMAAFMRDVVCEVLLRDLEELLDRYMAKMRKSFAKMNFDD